MALENNILRVKCTQCCKIVYASTYHIQDFILTRMKDHYEVGTFLFFCVEGIIQSPTVIVAYRRHIGNAKSYKDGNQLLRPLMYPLHLFTPFVPASINGYCFLTLGRDSSKSSRYSKSRPRKILYPIQKPNCTFFRL